MNAHDPNPPNGEPLAAEHEAGATMAADTIDFLKRLRPGGPWQLSAINPNGNNDVTTVTAIKDKKASTTEVSVIEFLLADLDPNEGEAPEEAKVHSLAELRSFEPEPLYVVDSGNGVQP